MLLVGRSNFDRSFAWGTSVFPYRLSSLSVSPFTFIGCNLRIQCVLYLTSIYEPINLTGR